MTSPARRRTLHPAAWWAWALMVAAAALRTTNPLVLGIMLASVALVVVARRRPTPWARTFTTFLALGAGVMVLRLALQLVFAPSAPGQVLVRLPEAELPAWAAGVRVGGPVTAEALLRAAYEGLRLLVLLAAVGAAGSLAEPYRLLRSLPAALHEAGVALSVALTVAPQAGAASARVRDARRLRGRPTRGLAAVRGVALPVLEGALDRSVELAASMDARGFGRRGALAPGRRRLARAASAAGLLAFALATYGILDTGAATGFGVPLLVAGAALVSLALVAGGGSRRTRYRPDPWSGPEWATAASGAAVLVGVVAAARLGVDLAAPARPELPALPLLPAVAALAAAAPAVLTPEPPA